jgi:xanthine/CO dehydrogenase XdhC/CoxF family maturation factor
VKELQGILKVYDAIKQAEGKAMRATIVTVKGSTYRRPGARMLIREDGSSKGALSSRCLDADVIERAKKAMGSHDALTVTYDMTTRSHSLPMIVAGTRKLCCSPHKNCVLFHTIALTKDVFD